MRVYEVDLAPGVAQGPPRRQGGAAARALLRRRSTSSCSRPRISRCRGARRATAGGSSIAACSTRARLSSRPRPTTTRCCGPATRCSSRRGRGRVGGTPGRRAARRSTTRSSPRSRSRSSPRACGSSRALAPALATAFALDHAHRAGRGRALRLEARRARRRRRSRSGSREGRARDLATQSTQLGPHRDDLVLELDGREAGSFASQGQLRAIMLAWKTAELAVLGAHPRRPADPAARRRLERARSGTQRVPVRAPRERSPGSASSRPPTRATCCSTAIAPITASRVVRFSNESGRLIRV